MTRGTILNTAYVANNNNNNKNSVLLITLCQSLSRSNIIRLIAYLTFCPYNCIGYIKYLYFITI